MPRPRKLKHDSIREALFEIRFDADNDAIPELVVSQLASNRSWSSWKASRTTQAELPHQVREADSRLKNLPILRFEDNGKNLVTIGPHAIAYHVSHPYPGWAAFSTKLEEMVDALLSLPWELSITRLGLRYINALEPELHLIGGIEDTTLVVRIDDEPITGSFNMVNTVECSEGLKALVRVVTPDLVKGIPEDTSLVIDLDLVSDHDSLQSSRDYLSGWLQNAHMHEKDIFFKFWPKQVLNQVVETWEETE